MYKIEIWRFHIIYDTYTSNDIKDILKWFRENWLLMSSNEECHFFVYKNNKEVSFDELYKLGFYKTFEEYLEEEEEC